MQQITAEIIAICKGKHGFGPRLSHKEAISSYMLDRCFDLTETGDNSAFEHVVAEALFDFIDGADQPGAFLRNIYDIHYRYNIYLEIRGMNKISFTDAICEAFMLVKVKKGTKFVNGFTEETADLVVEPTNVKSN